jgi:predicted anti-sigma-YlaC factor YlaD
LTALVLCEGCSIKRVAVNRLGTALASSGTTFEGDEDADLVGEALPFALKLMESLLAESPKHAGLLTATSSGFTQYSYAFVGQRVERAFQENVEESVALRVRARRLYVRGRGYGMRALEARYPGFGTAFERDSRSALARVRKRDVALLYWTAAAHGLAIAMSKDDPEMIAQLPVVEAMVERAMALDAGWSDGALEEFLINVEGARVGVKAEERRSRMKKSFEHALELSKGMRASLFVTYAENASIPAQNRKEFEELLGRALAIDVEKQPAGKLANVIAQRRARWLLGRADELFIARDEE